MVLLLVTCMPGTVCSAAMGVGARMSSGRVTTTVLGFRDDVSMGCWREVVSYATSIVIA